MSAKKVYFGLLGLIVLLVIGTGAAVYSGNILLKKTSDSLVQLKLEKNTIDEQKKALTLAKKDIEKYAELDSISKKIVPKDKDQAKSIREIINIAEQNGIKISSIDFPTSTLGITPPKTTTTEGESSDQSTQKPAAPPISQVLPADGLKGVYKLELTIESEKTNSTITYASLINLLTALENNRRTAQVSSLDISPSTNNLETLTSTVKINVFIKP